VFHFFQDRQVIPGFYFVVAVHRRDLVLPWRTCVVFRHEFVYLLRVTINLI
jgi:hypothetical protein